MSRRSAALACCLLALVTAALRAHEIPNEVTVRTFLKPEGNRLVFLVRAPLKAMREMDVPRRDGGNVDLERVDPVLHDAAMQWIADFVAVYEDGRPLPKAEVVAARISIPADRSFESYEQALANITRRRACRTTRTCSGTKGCSTWSSTIRSSRIGRASRSPLA